MLLIGGIGVFIIACGMLSSNIESAGSKQLKSLFSKVSDKKLLGVGIGAVTTAAVQSSAATIVLVIGFVNAGIMTLPLAATIIYGANIGTTITAWIASMSTVGSSISLVVIFSALTGIGAFTTLFAKKDSQKLLGGILTSFGLIFIGLFLMSTSMGDLANDEEVRNLIASLNNFCLLVVIGFLITALTQSSSVTTAILISMLGTATGMITLDQAIYITLGANIGSCVIVIISGYTGGPNAKRTALIHLFFNVIGVTVFVVAGFFMRTFFDVTFGSIFSNIFVGMPALQLATFHTSFKVITTVLVLPLTTPLLALISRIVPDVEEKSGPHLYYLDEHMLKNAPIAVQQLKSEVVNMSSIAMTNFKISIEMIKTLDFSRIDEFNANEEELDYLNKEIARYLVKLNKLPMGKKDRYYVSTVYKTITDLERMGDHAQNIVEYAQKMSENNGKFSPVALKEVDEMESLINELYEKIMKAYTTVDLDCVEEAYAIEEKVDQLSRDMENNHIKRLNNGTCTLEVGAEYLSMTSDAERVADHLINLGKSVREFASA